MKKSKFTEAQIVFALRQAETRTSVEEVCRKLGISQATFFNWKKKYGGLGVSDLRRLRQLEEENNQLRKLVADLSLDKQILQDVLKKSLESSDKARACVEGDEGLQDFSPSGLFVDHDQYIGMVLHSQQAR